MSKMKTGVQLYMVRDCIGSEEQIVSTLKSIKEAGYDAIELCGFLMDPKYDWLKLVQESGLEVCASHEIFEEMIEDSDKFIKKAKDFKTDYMVCAGTLKTDAESLASVKDMIAKLNELGKKFKDGGIQLLYHNHNMEFAKPDGGDKTMMELLIEGTDPELVWFEFDSYWTAIGGANPEAWMKRLGKRQRYHHINDCRIVPQEPGNPCRTATGSELGRGIMELSSLLAVDKENGVEVIVLETHEGWVDGCPIQSLKDSAAYLAKNL